MYCTSRRGRGRSFHRAHLNSSQSPHQNVRGSSPPHGEVPELVPAGVLDLLESDSPHSRRHAEGASMSTRSASSLACLCLRDSARVTVTAPAPATTPAPVEPIPARFRGLLGGGGGGGARGGLVAAAGSEME